MIHIVFGRLAYEITIILHSGFPLLIHKVTKKIKSTGWICKSENEKENLSFAGISSNLFGVAQSSISHEFEMEGTKSQIFPSTIRWNCFFFSSFMQIGKFDWEKSTMAIISPFFVVVVSMCFKIAEKMFA